MAVAAEPEAAEEAHAVRWRPWALGVTFYVLVRWLIVAASEPLNHPDSDGYREGVSFTGSLVRPWAASLLPSLLPGRAVVFAQATVSAIAFFVLAVALAGTVENGTARKVVAGGILLLGLAPRVTFWDTAILSESLAISTTAVIVAMLAHLERVPSWLFAIVFAVWIFTRDGHLYLGVLVVVGLTAWSWRQGRWTTAGLACVVLVWALLAYGNNRTIEGYNVALNVERRVEPHPDRLDWFIERGMPERQSDPFDEWRAGPGPATYARYIATHPAFMLEALPGVFGGPEPMVDHPEWRSEFTPPGLPVWPRSAVGYTLALVLAAGVSLVVAERHRVRAAIVPALLIASTVPHAVLAWHAAPWEFARHGVLMSFVLVVSCWWLIALTADSVAARADHTTVTR